MNKQQNPPQYWRISPGHQGWLWREQKMRECIAIGWDETGSAKGKDDVWLRERLKPKNMGWRPGAQSIRQLSEFFWTIRPGDKIVASASGKGIYGVGTVVGDYEFDPELYYKHSRKVRWETTFWHPVDIGDLDLPPGVYNKFHGRSTATIKRLEEDEWNHFAKKLDAIRTPFRNLAIWGGLIQSPEYENEVIILFSHLLQYLKMRIVSFGTRFPDAIVERKIGRKWKRENVEFELNSSGFCSHLDRCKQEDCYTIICWLDDEWDDNRSKKKFEIIELKTVLTNLL